MSERKVTIEEIRGAITGLEELGQRPSAARIRQIIGHGSQTTILAVRKALMAERLQDASPEVPMAVLRAAGEPLIKRLWGEAQKMADARYEARMRYLVAEHQTLQDDAEEGAKSAEHLEEAHSRISELEKQLFDSTAMRSQLPALLAVVDDMKVRQAELAGVGKPAPARSILLMYLDGRPDGASLDAIDAILIAAGYSEAAAHKARFHAVDAGEARSTEVGLEITEKGECKLVDARAAAASLT